MSIEAMKLALEALNRSDYLGWQFNIPVMKALRQAIEQASVATNDTKQERVAETSKNVHEPCGLECDCTNVCKQTNYKALWQQMCERCDELDKQLTQQAEPVAWNHAGALPPEQEEMKQAAYQLAPWLSAALDDPKVCKEYKKVINDWFDTAMPVPPPQRN